MLGWEGDRWPIVLKSVYSKAPLFQEYTRKSGGMEVLGAFGVSVCSSHAAQCFVSNTILNLPDL